ncbi:MAG: mammalian cell entry protein [Frankiales bacterium]|nr:mammalian cell entry protein [Frankiales bacterium]
MSAPPATGSAIYKRRISGVVFLLVISMLVYLTVLLYQKKFTAVVKVRLETDRIGNQLAAHSDVKIRGLVVGEVRSVSSKGDGAVITLGLKPGEISKIPADVRAALYPKTLFGEKEVVLTGGTTGGPHLTSRDTITQDRTETAVETEKAINDLLPLLQALKPQQLSKALNALSTALRGRGNELGQNLVRTAAYLKQLNPDLPTLQQDMAGLADFTNNTADATPDLLQVLDNLSASSRNLVEEKGSLDTFLTSSTSFASTTRQIVAENEQSLVQLAATSRAPLDLYARYSPEYPCLLAGLARYEPIIDQAFGGLQAGLHITVEAIKDNGGYTPAQTPKYRDARAPYCNGLPHPKVPAGDASFDDGYRTSTTPTSKAALDSVAAPLLGVPADQVPDISGLLLEPATQGSAVGLA